MQDSHAVTAIGDEGKLAGVIGTQLHVVDVIHFAAGVVFQVFHRKFWIRDVDDDQTVTACRNVSIVSCHVDVSSVSQRMCGD